MQTSQVADELELVYVHLRGFLSAHPRLYKPLKPHAQQGYF